jgi:hypothetical protein
MSSGVCLIMLWGFPEMFFNREVTETQSFAKTISLNLKVELVVRIENPIVGAFGLQIRKSWSVSAGMAGEIRT